MNPTEATTAGAAGIAAATASPSPGSAEESADEDPVLAPLRALLDAHDTAFTNHDLEGLMATFSPKATIMGVGPGEIWSGPDEIKAAHVHLFEGFDVGEQNFDYEFNIGGAASDMGWMMTSGNVTGKKEGADFTFPLNLSITATKENGKWLIAAMHFSILTETEEGE
jgi:ketosteroid isomerase-like protein